MKFKDIGFNNRIVVREIMIPNGDTPRPFKRVALPPIAFGKISVSKNSLQIPFVSTEACLKGHECAKNSPRPGLLTKKSSSSNMCPLSNGFEATKLFERFSRLIISPCEIFRSDPSPSADSNSRIPFTRSRNSLGSKLRHDLALPCFYPVLDGAQ